MKYEKLNLREIYSQRMKHIFYGPKTYMMYEGPEAPEMPRIASIGPIIFEPTRIELL